MKEQEAQSAAEPKTAPEPLINPKNPLNVNVNANVNENEKENDNADVDVKGNANVKGKEDGNADVDGKRGFVDSLILNDFDDEEEGYSYEEGSASAYMERLRLQELEKRVRSSLEEELEDM